MLCGGGGEEADCDGEGCGFVGGSGSGGRGGNDKNHQTLLPQLPLPTHQISPQTIQLDKLFETTTANLTIDVTITTTTTMPPSPTIPNHHHHNHHKP